MIDQLCTNITFKKHNSENNTLVNSIIYLNQNNNNISFSEMNATKI